MRLHRWLLTLSLVLAMASSALAAPVEADTIFQNGTVLTIKPMREVHALAVRGGVIVAVGEEKDVAPFRGPSTQVVDLHGRTLMPGFVEPHLHIDLSAMNLGMAQVGSEKPGGMSIADVKKTLAAAVKKVPAGQWLNANMFDPSRTTPRFGELTAKDLDAVSTTVPIFVLNASGHIGYVNHKALALAGITDKTPDPPSGHYGRDKQGHLTGQCFEPTSFEPFLKTQTPPPPAVMRNAFLTVLKSWSRKGVTTVGDLNTGAALGVDDEIAILRSIAGQSPVRMRCYLAFIGLLGKPAPVKPFEGDDVLRFIGIKVTADGSTQGFTAALNQPYLGKKTKGALDWPSTPKLIDQIRPYFDAGWQIATHANGDRAIDQALDLYGALLQNTKDKAARRLRIEHFTVSTPRHIDRVRALGLTCGMTIGHVYFWGDVFDRYVLGPQRANRIDAAGDLKRRGVRFSFHSDCTVTSVDPLRYMMTAVNRRPQVNPPQRLGADQAITVDDALRAMTLDAAYQLFLDDKVGSLEVGKLADLVILDQNPRKVAPERLPAIRVHDVYMGGKRQGP